MKYTINKLAKLLDVSTNTIRRYEDMGYFSSVRNEENGYRYYDDDAIINLTHVRLMRRYGFTHEEIQKMETFGFDAILERLEKRYQSLEDEIKSLENLRHRLRDDINLTRKIVEMKDQIIEMECVEMYYITYMENGKLLLDEDRLNVISKYLEASPEISRGCLIGYPRNGNGKPHVRNIWAVKTKDVKKHNLPVNHLTTLYPKQSCLMGIIKARWTDDIDELEKYTEEFGRELQKYETYMQEKGYEQASDEILGLMITKLKEADVTYLYLLLSIPVRKK